MNLWKFIHFFEFLDVCPWNCPEKELNVNKKQISLTDADEFLLMSNLPKMQVVSRRFNNLHIFA
jgi:hypothetical protein